MVVVIGTPTHECKEYGIYRWLDSVVGLEWPIFHTFISDNSNTEEFSERMRQYCGAIGLRSSIEWVPGVQNREDEFKRKISREILRRKILTTPATHWLSWECDILVEPKALEKMFHFTKYFDIVSSNYPNRDNPKELAGGIGFALFARNILESQSWLTGGGFAECDTERPNCYYSGDSWWMQRAIWAGAKHMDFTNLIEIKHLGCS
jgi:hypothetical protein